MRKKSLFAGTLSSPTLDELGLEIKIKVVGKDKTLVGAELQPRGSATVRPIRPYTLRVKRDHGGGLWTFEDNEGQLYLAVLSREVNDFRQERERNARVPFALPVGEQYDAC